MLNSKFEQYGDIFSAAVSLDDNWESKGYGFVTFKSEAAAQKAIKDNEDCSLYQYDEQNPEFKLGLNVFFKNLPHTLTEEDLTNLTLKYGKTSSVAIKKDSVGNSLGYGFAFFAS